MSLEGAAEKLPENVEIVDTPQARFRLIYDFHGGHYGVEGNPHSPKELGKADAFAMEVPSRTDFAHITHAQRMANQLVDLAERPANQQISDPTEYVVRMQEQQIPVYFIDLIEPDATYHYAGLASMAAGSAINVGAGILAADYLAKKIKANEPMNRRSFLKGAIAATVVGKGAVQAAATIGDVGATLEGHLTGNVSKPGQIEKNIRTVSESINPETYTLFASFRDAVFAHKLHQIAQELRQTKGRKPEIAIQIGRNHAILDSALRADSEKRLSYIRNAWMLVNKILPLKERGVRISSVARLEFVNGRWTATDAHRDPALQKIED